ncbi:hypothetical protein [Terriglobus aquaticus]|uniref:Uncharacterized protein n=1 Tax=Terriglobus aquaticus TaxID=940139 RepID=A0ABW9KKP6_9BACT|nr:hypothetical protein [Terriglobus aquaticus]
MIDAVHRRCASLLLLSVAIAGLPGALHAQARTQLPAERELGSGLKRTRLYLKDGTYQVVLNYRVVGKNVVYRSAERAGEQEEIPVNLVDLDATKRWEEQQANGGQVPATQIDPELAREEADRAARTPLVAPNLHLPDDDSVLALDTFHGQPQLAVLQQTSGELNRQTAHNVVRAAVNPFSTAHQLVEIPGERAAVQLHVPDPVLYVRLDDDSGGKSDEAPAGALVVDTHGNKGIPQPKVSAESQYVIVRVDVRRGERVVTSFSINLLGSAKRQADVVATTTAVMPGGHWLKITPAEPLTFGEYALMEVLDARNVNLGVWDFGVHPTAGENRDAILPEVPRAPELERRRARPSASE